MLHVVSYGVDEQALSRKQRAVVAGALPAIVGAMRAQPKRAAVVQWGCRALLNLVHGSDVAAMGRKRSAEALGCMEVVGEAMRQHPKQKGIQLWGCRAMLAMAVGPLPRLPGEEPPPPPTNVAATAPSRTAGSSILRRASLARDSSAWSSTSSLRTSTNSRAADEGEHDGVAAQPTARRRSICASPLPLS